MSNEGSGLFGDRADGLFGRDAEDPIVQPPVAGGSSEKVETSASAVAPSATESSDPDRRRRRAWLLAPVMALLATAALGLILVRNVEDTSTESSARQSIADLGGYADVDVDLADGILTLKGEIPDEASRRTILAAVAQLGGVETIDDQLQITAFAARPGEVLRPGLDIADDVGPSDESEPGILLDPTTVPTVSSTVTVAPGLSTTLAPSPSTTTAAPITSTVVQTTSTTATPATTTTTTFGPAELQISADAALHALGLEGPTVLVEGTPPIATLVGEVTSASDSDAAAAAISEVIGISAVDNQLTIVETPDDSADAGEGSSGDDGDANEPAVDSDAVATAVTDIQNEAPIRFEMGRAGLSDGVKAELAGLAEALIADPETIIHIEGHTCDLGASDKNQRLSERRALSVAEFLTGLGVSPAQITSSGSGETRPAFDNSDPTQAANNRRVEITVLE